MGWHKIGHGGIISGTATDWVTLPWSRYPWASDWKYYKITPVKSQWGIFFDQNSSKSKDHWDLTGSVPVPDIIPPCPILWHPKNSSKFDWKYRLRAVWVFVNKSPHSGYTCLVMLLKQLTRIIVMFEMQLLHLMYLNSEKFIALNALMAHNAHKAAIEL